MRNVAMAVVSTSEVRRRSKPGLLFCGPLVRGEDRYTVPALLPRQTAPYRHTLGGTLIRPGAGQAQARGHEVDVFGRPNER